MNPQQVNFDKEDWTQFSNSAITPTGSVPSFNEPIPGSWVVTSASHKLGIGNVSGGTLLLFPGEYIPADTSATARPQYSGQNIMFIRSGSNWQIYPGKTLDESEDLLLDTFIDLKPVTEFLVKARVESIEKASFPILSPDYENEV